MPALQLVVTQKAVMLDDKEICSIVNGDIAKGELYRDGVTIVKLAQELKAQDRSMYIQQRNDQHSFSGTIVMQADKSLTFNVLKKIIYRWHHRLRDAEARGNSKKIRGAEPSGLGLP